MQPNTRSTLSLALLALAPFAAAQMGDIPSCAMQCFSSAIDASPCTLLDPMCQCTTGRDAITKATVKCLCEESSCADDEMMGKFDGISDASQGREGIVC